MLFAFCRNFRNISRLMTTQDSHPSSLTEPICTSMPYRPNCNVIFASWMGPKMVLSPSTPFVSPSGSSRMAEHSRYVVVIPCHSSFIAGWVTKSCPTSTGFENSASRETCPRLLNFTEGFLCTECCPFLDARSNKSEVSCFVSFVSSPILVKW